MYRRGHHQGLGNSGERETVPCRRIARRTHWAWEARDFAGRGYKGGMRFPQKCSSACGGRRAEKGGHTLPAWSAITGRLGIALAALDHAQGIAAFAARLTAQLVHQLPHQENAPSAEPQLCWVEVRHCGEVERMAFVEQLNLQ